MTSIAQTLRLALSLSAFAATLIVTGCGSGFGGSSSPVDPVSKFTLGGSVHGGQQPVSGATIQLYAVSTSGYGAAATPLISSTITTTANGSFNITGQYSCSGVDQVYITAMGGNPGLGAGKHNDGIGLMAALGSCSNLLANASTTFINMNEVTTVAAAWSLGRFMTSPSHAGTSSTNITGLANAFAAANKLANFQTGVASGPGLPAGATLPVDEINTLANILAACINSDGSVTPGQTCYKLFNAAKASDGTTPTDTITAAINIANNASQNVSTLFDLSSPTAPFQPSLHSTPTNWLIGIRYTGGGLSTPSALALDNAGNVWVANAGNNSVSEFNSTGAALSPVGGYTGGGLATPSGIAMDASGNAWVSNSTGASVTRVAPLGGSTTNFTGGGLNAPSSIAIDGTGAIWIANKGNNSVTQLSSTGTPISGSAGFTGGGLNQPIAIVVNAQ